MTETPGRPVHGSDGLGYTTPPPRQAGDRPSRHLSYYTWEWSVELGFGDLTALIDEVYALWDAVNPDEPVGDMFEALLNHLDELRKWTGPC